LFVAGSLLWRLCFSCLSCFSLNDIKSTLPGMDLPCPPLSSSLVNLLKKKGFLVYFLNARFFIGDKKNNVLGRFHNASVIGSLVTLLLVLLL
jgi:hypothetical protein